MSLKLKANWQSGRFKYKWAFLMLSLSLSRNEKSMCIFLFIQTTNLIIFLRALARKLFSFFWRPRRFGLCFYFEPASEIQCWSSPKSRTLKFLSVPWRTRMKVFRERLLFHLSICEHSKIKSIYPPAFLCEKGKKISRELVINWNSIYTFSL